MVCIGTKVAELLRGSACILSSNNVALCADLMSLEADGHTISLAAQPGQDNATLVVAMGPGTACIINFT